MNVLELLVSAMYRQAEGNALAQKLIRAAVEGYNQRMAEINRAGGTIPEDIAAP